MIIRRREAILAALAAIVPYHVMGLICVFCHRFAPMWLATVLYIGHFAGLGALIGALVSVRATNPTRAVLWGALIGIVVSVALLP